MRALLFLLISISANNLFAAADCASLQNPLAQVIEPEPLISATEFSQHANQNSLTRGFYFYSWKQAEFLCSQVEPARQDSCLSKAASILDQALSCLNDKLTVKEMKPLAWSYLRNNEIQNLVTEALFKKAASKEEAEIQKNLWTKFRILLLPGMTITPSGTTKLWRIQDLYQIELGLAQLKKAVIKAVGRERALSFSHLWGAGTTLARLGEKSVAGQLGEMDINFPLQINIVIEVLNEKKTPELIAQQLAHENSHSHDYLRGEILTGEISGWSETGAARIFEMCSIKPSYEVELYNCRKKNLDWFNFHPTAYPAIRSAEFYTKMLDEWVRENLGLRPKGQYRCQNKATLGFWREMELNLIGEVISPACP